jgi:hypothetical protein
MDEEENIGAALDAPEYMYGGAPVIEDPASFAVAPTGTQMDLSFLDEPYSEGWDESKKALWQQKWISGISPTPADAAKTAQSILADERKAATERSAQRGKPMTSEQVSQLTQRNSVANTLQMLDSRVQGVPDKDRGPFYGKARGVNPYDKQAQEIAALTTGVVTPMARGVFNEVGVITATDEARYRAMLPTLSDTPDISRTKMANLKTLLRDSKIAQIENMKKAGLDVGGFEEDLGLLVSERDSGQKQQQDAQAAKQQQAPLLPVMRGKQGERVVLITPENPAFDPTENNGQPYYEAE